MNISHRRALLTAAAGLSLIGGAAGCSEQAPQPAPSQPAPPQSSADGGSAATGSSNGSDPSAAEEYADGTYSAVGSYQSPNGTETIDVQLSLEDDRVSDVEVVSNPTNPNTQRFQGEFVDGIKEVVVGKPIDELNVSKVGGSSLTSGGFRDALEQIKAEARL